MSYSKLTEEEKVISKEENFIVFLLGLTEPGPGLALVQNVQEVVTEPGPGALQPAPAHAVHAERERGGGAGAAGRHPAGTAQEQRDQRLELHCVVRLHNNCRIRFGLQPTWLSKACSSEILLSHSMSDMMMATIRLTMIIEPKMIRAMRRIMVKIWERRELELAESLHRSSNSNSPRTITNILRKDLPTLSKLSVSLPK